MESAFIFTESNNSGGAVLKSLEILCQCFITIPTQCVAVAKMGLNKCLVEYN